MKRLNTCLTPIGPSRSVFRTGVTAAALIIGASPLAAQEVPGNTEASEPTNEYGVSDIVVTAGKREERLSEVGGGISAVSGDVLEQRAAASLQDYLALVPGISIQSLGTTGWGTVQIRGIASQGVSTTTATYIDEIPVGSASATTRSGQYTTDLDPSDLERVEVLKGPQGTLYGASSMGGVIKYVTRKPSLSDPEIRLSLDSHVVDGGNVGLRMRGGFSAPVVEGGAAIRLSGYYRRDAGYVDNLALDDSNVNGGEAWGVRGSFYIKPADDLDINLSGMYQHSRADGFNIVDLDPITLEPIDRDLGQRRYIPESFTVSNLLLSAEIKWDTDVGSLVSATGYSKSRPHEEQDLSTTDFLGFSPTNKGLYDGIHYTTKFTQELRFASRRFGPVEFIAGGFYTHERLNDSTGYYFANDLGEPIESIPPQGTSRRFGTLEEFAGFANATLYLSDRFDITGGYRHAKISQKQTSVRAGPVFGDVREEFDFSEKADTFLAGARFRASDNLLFYARAASGYRPGSSRAIPPGAPADLPGFYTSDSIWSYEGGVKAKALDGRLSVDLAGFWIDWTDIQTLIAFGRFTTGGNAGSAVSKGFELQTAFQAARGLTVGGNVAYTDSRFTEDNAASGISDGDRLYFVPQWTGSAYAEYSFRIGGDLDATVGADMAYQSSMLDITRFPLSAYTLYGLHAGVRKGNFEARLYVKNLTDKRARTGSFGYFPPLDYQVTVNQPRTFGVSISQKF